MFAKISVTFSLFLLAFNTPQVAVSISNGDRIGKGTGYFDLEYAILEEMGCVDQGAPIVTVVHPIQVYEGLPFKHKDVSTDYIVTPEAIIRVENPGHRPSGLEWKPIDGRLISSLRPLRELKRDTSDCNRCEAWPEIAGSTTKSLKRG